MSSEKLAIETEVTMPETLLTFVHISDTHIHHDPTYTREGADTTSKAGARALVDAINALPFEPAFVLHTGDVAYDPEPEAYQACREILGEIRFPVHYVAGNHDDSRALQNALVQSGEPQDQLHYSFVVNGVEVAVVDSNGPANPPAGYFTDSQLEWVRQICSEPVDRPLVIATHHNPIQVNVPWLDDFMGARNGEEFHRAILPARHRLRGVFFGHVHQNLDFYRDGVLYTSCLSSWMQFQAYPGLERTTSDIGAEPGYSIVMINADGTFIRRCRFPVPRVDIPSSNG
ncbi:MAG: metallophosphoesterase family protein [Chloroflexota bacterium]